MSTAPRTPDADKRARILAAALEVCAEHGVHAARMEEVAARAQVSKGTLYRFFQSKEDLFLATLIDSYEQGLQAVVRAPGASASAMLEAVLEGLCEVLASVAPRAAVLYQVWGVVAGSPEFEARLHAFLRDFHRERQQEFEAIVRLGQRQGEFPADADPRAVADGIGALLSGFIYRGAFDPLEAGRDALRACFDTLVLAPLGIDPAARARPTREVEHG